MLAKDLREWIDLLEKEKELVRVKTEVDWDLEIGGILRHVCDTEGPALLFEDIKDYKNTLCKKLFTGSLATFPRVALMLGLPKETPYKEIIQVWRKRSKKPLKPVVVVNAPCKENILKGDDVNLFQLPVPHWSKFDGGRYLSTFAGVVTRDANTGWENSGVYRAMIQDRRTTTMAIAQGQHVWHHNPRHYPISRVDQCPRSDCAPEGKNWLWGQQRDTTAD